MEHTAHEPQAALPVLTDESLETLVDALRRDPEALAHVVSRAGPDDGRSDDWTPFARRFFLQTLAETGRVSEACRWAQLSKQSAYALRARDPVFAAGWDAACEIARTQLADALFEKAIDGVTETIVKDGEVVAERHRFDSRLSIAVLHRLDKRCDRSVELGSEHLAVVRNWDEFLAHIGRGEEQSAQALLQAAPHGQFGQLPQSGNPTGDSFDEDHDEQEIDIPDRCWTDDSTGETVWMTSFPPPPASMAVKSTNGAAGATNANARPRKPHCSKPAQPPPKPGSVSGQKPYATHGSPNCGRSLISPNWAVALENRDAPLLPIGFAFREGLSCVGVFVLLPCSAVPA